ncbi:MAG: cell division protein FtsZ, partial [Bacteroidetes bacterium]|nr:cell division protein FtsZ [Bacteroidota bacterium]
KASEIAQRRTAMDSNFYKGEKNLKNLDSPAIHRRSLKHIRTNDDKEADEEISEPKQVQRKAGNDDSSGLNDRSERIDKRDSEQPAFLRKIMD